MIDVVVTGVSLLSCLGDLNQTWESIWRGRSGIKKMQVFPELPPLPVGLINDQPIDLDKLIYRLVNAALWDANLESPLPECGVVIGSSRAFQGKWELLAAKSPLVSLDNWYETLPMFVSIQGARCVGSCGPVLAPMAACATGIWAIAQGYELIQQGYCERVIVGGVEAPITPLTIAGFQQMGALAPKGCYPFDRDRQGLVLAEGGAVLVLETKELAAKRQVRVYGRLLGFGLSCDGDHVSAPSVKTNSAIKALKQCLTISKLKSEDINYIHAHGTGTRLNDAREASLIKELFPQKVAVSSTKGATGHTLGASGAMGAAFCLLALKNQQLPPCVGLMVPEFELNLVRKGCEALVNQVMCLSFGFGGQNAAVAFGRSHNTHED